MGNIAEKLKNAVYFAKSNFRGDQSRIFGIRTPDRRQHMYIIGRTGTGKSTLIKNLVRQDINAGRGLCLVDPHGDLAESMLQSIPEERKDDVIYFNPVDVEHPMGFNVLEVSDPEYKHLVAQGLLGIFTKIWANVWSARMEYILQNCILALMDTPGETLMGIQRILVDKEYRNRIIENVQDPVVRNFWIAEFDAWQDRFRVEAIVPIQNKVGQFLSTGMIRNMVGQPKSSFDVLDIINSGKILIADVAKGRIGEENSQLLGAMIITKVQLAAMERVRMAEEERRDFYLYVDEFQNFSTDSFADILSEARKYRLNLTIAHQYIGQLVTDTSTKVRDAVFGNVGTMVTFRVGAGDAEFLEKEFTPEFTMNDLVALPNFNAYVKLMINGTSTRPFSALTLPPMKISGTNYVPSEEVVENSRKRYGRVRDNVEKSIAGWWEVLAQTGEGGGFKKFTGGAGDKYEATCAHCGSKTFTGFKPDGKRSVYCRECLSKVQTGEISSKDQQPHRHESAGQDKQKIPENRIKTVPKISEGEPVFTMNQKPEKTISLKELEKRREEKPKKNEHLEELRKSLHEMLKGGSDNGSSEETEPAYDKKEESKERTPDKEKDNKNSQKTLKPGDSIKF